MAQTRLYLLGPVRVERDGAPVHGFESRKALALLCYLALQDHPRTRGHLAELFWEGKAEERGRGNLNRVLHNLSQVVPGALEATRQTIGLARDGAVWRDAGVFEQLVAQNDAESLAAAAGLYRGEVLAELQLEDCPEFEQWLEGAREHWRQRQIQVLHRLVQHHLRQGSPSEGIAWATRLLEIDPWQEQAHRAMMRLLAQDGQRSAALAQYETCRRVLAEELGVEPEQATVALYERIRDGAEPPAGVPAAHDLLPTRPAATYRLPAPTTSFVNRAAELAQVFAYLQGPACRLVTLVGPGGIGKSRLALHAAHRLASADRQEAAFANGVAFVPLAAVEAASWKGARGAPAAVHALAAATADALHFALAGSDAPHVQLLNYLREKQLLLVLDNFEHLLAAAGFLVELLQEAPQLKMLVTSRGRLNVPGEQIVELDCLHFPTIREAADQVDWEHYSALELFQQRAQAAHPRFAIAGAEQSAAVRICQLVDGLPLGIELAASWVRLLPCQEIAREIEATLDFLHSSGRGVRGRHRSLHAVFTHSWNGLIEAEQRALRRLSVFRGGFDRAAAVYVADASLSLLASLVDNSLVRRAADRGDSSVRYELLEVIRQYAAEKLGEAQSGAGAEQDEVRDRHSDYYLAFLYQRTADLQGGRQQAALAEINREIENIRGAWRWAIGRGHIAAIGQAAESLFHFYNMRSWFQEGAAAFAQAAARLAELHADGGRAETGIVWGRVLAKQGYLTLHIQRQVEAKMLLERSLDILRPLGIADELEFPLHRLAAVGFFLGTYEEAWQSCQEALAISAARGDRYNVAVGNLTFGQIAYMQGRYADARRLCEQSLATQREIGDLWTMAFTLSCLGSIARVLGEHQEAQRCHSEALVIGEALEDARGMAMCLNNLGDTATALANHAEARQLYQTSLAMFKEVGNHWGVSGSLARLGYSELALGEPAAARDYFHEALRVARNAQAIPRMLEALAGIAIVLAEEDPELARTLATLVWRHPSAVRESKDRAAGVLALGAPQPTADDGAAVQKQRDDQTLDQVAAAILMT